MSKHCSLQVGYREVHLNDPALGELDALALKQRVSARSPSTDTWKGFSVSMPFLPGEATAMSTATAEGSRFSVLPTELLVGTELAVARLCETPVVINTTSSCTVATS